MAAAPGRRTSSSSDCGAPSCPGTALCLPMPMSGRHAPRPSRDGRTPEQTDFKQPIQDALATTKVGNSSESAKTVIKSDERPLIYTEAHHLPYGELVIPKARKGLLPPLYILIPSSPLSRDRTTNTLLQARAAIRPATLASDLNPTICILSLSAQMLDATPKFRKVELAAIAQHNKPDVTPTSIRAAPNSRTNVETAHILFSKLTRAPKKPGTQKPPRLFSSVYW